MIATVNKNLYTSIYKLPLSRFIDCYVDNDLRALIITGDATEEELASLWQDIADQYNEASAGLEQQYYLSLNADVVKLQIKSHAIMMIVGILKQGYVKKFADYLNILCSKKYTWDINNREQYDQQLDSCLAKTAFLQLQLTEKQNSLKGFIKDEDAKPTRADFQKTLITLSDFAGRELDENVITVFSYCERLKRYIDHIENMRLKKAA